jgi:hypothetical protein
MIRKVPIPAIGPRISGDCSNGNGKSSHDDADDQTHPGCDRHSATMAAQMPTPRVEDAPHLLMLRIDSLRGWKFNNKIDWECRIGIKLEVDKF